ncbi:MAG: SUMF1/EgtB/PvdO family nonheme iron enzyme, partial [Nannocystaceae bacterium]
AVMASVASGELGSEAVAAVLEGEVDPGRHGALFGVVRQALDPDPSRRPRDGVHLLELLQRALATADPALDSAAATDSGSGSDGLGELARRYLDEVSAVGQGPSTPQPPQVPSGPGPTSPWLAASPPREPAGGRARSRTMPPEGITTPPASVLRQGEATDIGTLPPPPPVANLGAPDWGGRYKLPSGTYAAVRDAPQPAGDGAVRGPAPGGAGSDAGVLRLDPAASSSSAQWSSRAPEVSASSWLRPAPPRAKDRGVGGLFEPTKWVRELPHGLRKRWVLSGDGPPRPPLDGLPGGVPPISTGAPEAIEDDITPSEAIPIGGILSADEPSIPSGPESERETPPDPEGFEVRSLRVAQEQEPRSTAEPEPLPELPPLLEPSRPAAGLPPADTGPARSRVQEPFRAPRLPGPHGPPAALMTLLLVLLAGTVAVGATLSAVAARGEIAALWSSGRADRGEADEADEATLDDGDSAAAVSDGCPAGMIEIADEAGPYCIDRVEYPQIDRVPATDVSLPEAEQACAARGHQLCTEAQWVRACRGAADWPFPYGPDRQAGRCRLGDATAHPGPAGADPTCVTPEGVLDLVGNAAEWTREGAVLGGSVRSKKTSGCSARQRVRPSTQRPVVGFRCCLAQPTGGAESGSASGPTDVP